ncbi:MAG: hypothetical protein BGO67_08915 [Alphaproteobacteria bacterium 41-28]|nr:MAG: hypothetical protein BGO67_08915 [Alphaproteobacteria bacterium 41-28]
MLLENSLTKVFNSVATLTASFILLGPILTSPSLAMEDNPSTSNKSALTKSLRFRDDNQVQDNLDFLFKKHRGDDLVLAKSEELLNENAAKEILSHLLSKYPTEKEAITHLMYAFHSQVYDPALCELDDRSINLIREDARVRVEREFGSVPLSALESLIYDRLKAPTLTIIEDLVIGAQQIDHLQITDGVHPILFLGRSPCFLQLAYEKLCAFYHPERLEEPHIFHLSYSGTPDMENIRKGDPFYDDVIATRARNLVTPTKLKFYCEYMDRQGMGSIKDELTLIDAVGKGGSLDTILRMMRYYYEIYLGRATMPDVKFLAMNRLERPESPEYYNYNTTTHDIEFKSNPELGIRPLRIKATQLFLSYGTTKILDYGPIQDFTCHGISFPPQKWREESLDELKRGGQFCSLAYGYIGRFLENTIKEHDILYRKKVSEILD